MIVGKSTLFKQMKILAREGGYTETELQRYKSSIYNNCISQMQMLCEFAEEQQTAYDSPQNKEYVANVLQLAPAHEMWTPQLCDQLIALWADSGVQSVFAQPAVQGVLNESAPYFFADLLRFRDPDSYTPTKQDVLRARVRSTGIEEAEFRFDELKFRMLDVGGQRNERRKWIHCFSMDHQLLTNRGFLWAHEVQAAMASGEPIHLAGYSESRDALVWEAPLAFVYNDARQQRMIRFRQGSHADGGAGSVDLLCTPGHDMYVAREGQGASFAKVKAERLLGGEGAVFMKKGVRAGLQRTHDHQRRRDFVEQLQLHTPAQLGAFLVWLGERVLLGLTAALSEWSPLFAERSAVLSVLEQLSGAELRMFLSPVVQEREQGMVRIHGWQQRDLLVHCMILAGYTVSFERVDDNDDNWMVRWSCVGNGAASVDCVSEEVYAGATWCVTMPSGFVVARRAHLENSVVRAASAPTLVGNCFDGVTVVLFCASLSEYDQTLREDHTQNRMSESLLLFDEIVNSPWFRKTPIVLFLNKMDLFKEKIWKVPLTVCFQNYRGPNEPKEAMEYIRSRFEELPQDRSRVLYIHYTCAVSTENVEVVFRVVKETLLKEIIYNFAI